MREHLEREQHEQFRDAVFAARGELIPGLDELNLIVSKKFPYDVEYLDEKKVDAAKNTWVQLVKSGSLSQYEKDCGWSVDRAMAHLQKENLLLRRLSAEDWLWAVHVERKRSGDKPIVWNECKLMVTRNRLHCSLFNTGAQITQEIPADAVKRLGQERVDKTLATIAEIEGMLERGEWDG